MTTSIFPKTPVTQLPVKTGTVVGGSSIILPLNIDDLTSEHVLTIEVSQTFATAAPTSFNELKILDKLRFDTGSEGTTIDLDGEAFIELERWREKMAASRSTLGLVSKARVTIDIHHEMDGALADLVTALETGAMDVCNLELFMPQDLANCFVGGVGAGVATYKVSVDAERLPELTGVGSMEFLQNEQGEFYLDENKNPIENPYFLVGQAQRKVVGQIKRGNTTGEQDAFRMKVQNLTRAIQLLAFDNNGNRSDDVIRGVKLVIGDQTPRFATFHKIQAMNERKLNASLIGTGKCLIDFANINSAWLDLREVREAYIEFEIDPAYAGGNWTVSAAQDTVIGL